MNKSILWIIVVVILLVVLGVIFLGGGNKGDENIVPPPQTTQTAMVSGWLFNIKVSNEVQKYLIRDDGENVTYLIEEEILKAVRSDKWVEPTLKWTPQQWTTKCDEQKKLVQSCSQTEFNNFINSLNCKNDPTQKLCGESFESWRADCENNNQRLTSCILVPYEKYQTLMENYLSSHHISGSILDAFVVSIPILGSDQVQEK